jgi:hypothetical protein
VCTSARARGIHGSGARGIHGSGARGIHGSGSRTFQMAVMGPVELISTSDSTNTVTVLGQTFSTTAEMIETLSAGDYVVIAGTGGVASVMYNVGQQYVAGSSPVWVRNTVGTVEPGRASLTLGGVVLDYSTQLSIDPNFSPVEGDLIEVEAVQPLPGGTLILM